MWIVSYILPVFNDVLVKSLICVSSFYNTEYCVIRNDEISLIDIYDNRTEGISVLYENGKPKCVGKTDGGQQFLDEYNIWFNLVKY